MCAAADRRLFALHDTPSTALNGKGIRTGPCAHFGPRETYLLVGQSVPCLSEHVRGYWYSCGFTQPRVCVNIKYRAEIALSFKSTPFPPSPLPDCNIPGRVLNTLATKILICYVTPSNGFVLVKLVRFEFVTVPLRSRCCITVTG